MKFKNCIVSHKADVRLIDILRGFSYNVYVSKDNMDLDESVRDHPDMSCHWTGESLIVAEAVYDYYREIVADNICLIKSKSFFKNKYPYDVWLNVFVANNKYYHIGNTDPDIESIYKKKGYKKVLIKQGYSNCSVLRLADDKFATTDKAIYKALIQDGANVILLANEGIKLPPYKSGLIGGCGGYDFENHLFLYGDINTYLYKDILLDYIRDSNTEIFYPEGVVFSDLGSILFF